eukprot:s604_g10.t1
MGAAMNMEVSPEGRPLHLGIKAPREVAFTEEAQPGYYGMPGPMPMQPSYPSMNAPVQMAPAPQPQGSERSSNEPQAFGGLREYDMTLPLDAGLHLESDDGVWLSSRSDGPRKDDENYDTNTLLAIPRVIYEKERWEDSWFAQQAKTSGRGNRSKGAEEPWGRHAKADDLEAREEARDDQQGGARREGRRRGAADRDWRHDLFNYATERERQARNNRGGWGHDDRGAWGGPDVRDRDREAPRKRGRGYDDHDWDRGQDWQARPDTAGGATAAAPSFKPADDEETRKRRKRMERFSKAAPAAAHGDAAPS